MFAGCTVVSGGDFSYLDEQDTEMHPVLIMGSGKNIEISLPRSLDTEIPETLWIKPEGLFQQYAPALLIPYEWSETGSDRMDEAYFSVEVGIAYSEGKQIISDGLDVRVQLLRGSYESLEPGPWRDRVLDRMKLEEYRSGQGYQWLMSNLPTIKPFHENFRTPISEQRELVVWFWYSEDHVEDHPQWHLQRMSLARRILDTVRISDSE
jgi:hypothetical protein